MEKIILGLVLVLGLSFCMAFGVVATDEDCPFPSRIHEGMDVDQGSGDGWLGIQQGVQQQQMPRYPQYQEPSQYQGTEDWLDISGGNLSYGMRSDNVMNLQQRLSQDPSIYPEGLTTGFFGELTQQAVKRFQASQGLSQTGIVDQDFKNFLFPPKPIKPPEWPEAPELQIDDSISILPMPMPMPLNGCVQKCRSMGYSYGICRSCAVYPGQKPCKEGEVSIGSTSDCSIEEVVDGGIVGIQVGIQKACCCGERQTDICTDSDGGINKYVKGKTCQPSRKISAIDEDAISGSASLFCKTDKCQVNTVMNIPIGSGSHNIAEGMLTEYYCKDGVMMSKTIECIAGCEDGACVRPTGVTIEEVCSSDAHCLATQFCEYHVCAAGTGRCVEVPEVCTDIGAPVCGCDNKTYGNDCYRKVAKVSKKHDGECKTEKICGDVNCDGAVNVIDVVKVEKCSENSDDCDISSDWAADVDCDGNIDGNDSKEIYKRALDPGYLLQCCVTDCIGDGEILQEFASVKGECCAGLHEISSGYRNGVSYCTSEVCGNGACRGKENKYNCPQDCEKIQPTLPVDVQPTTNVQPIITLIREAINKLNSAIRLLGGISPVNGGWAH